MKNFLTALRLFILLLLVTGVLYPLFITVVGMGFFPKKAAGSLIIVDKEVRGSELIGQNFTDPKYFWPRPSAVEYVPMPSGGSNLSPTSAELKTKFMDRKEKMNGAPQDMLFASGSGLDPHITPGAARYQLSRIIAQRGLSEEQANSLKRLVDASVEKRTLGITGEERVNVLKLNLALDRMLYNYEK